MRWALALLATAQLIIALDATIIFVALHDMGRALQINAQQLQWWSVPTVSLAAACCWGRAADLIGRRRFYRLGMLLFALASLLGALAPNATLLIIARGAGHRRGIAALATLALINTRGGRSGAQPCTCDLEHGQRGGLGAGHAARRR